METLAYLLKFCSDPEVVLYAAFINGVIWALFNTNIFVNPLMSVLNMSAGGGIMTLAAILVAFCVPVQFHWLITLTCLASSIYAMVRHLYQVSMMMQCITIQNNTAFTDVPKTKNKRLE